MKTRFILINTSHAGNVGAAARAMKTMGFTEMVLVAPRWAKACGGGCVGLGSGLIKIKSVSKSPRFPRMIFR